MPSRPVLLYDNDCRICSRFADLAKKGSKGWVDAVGLFTERGTRIKSEFFSPGDHPDEMFWLLTENTGYGGRSGLLPLMREIIRGRVLRARIVERRVLGGRTRWVESLGLYAPEESLSEDPTASAAQGFPSERFVLRVRL